MAGRPTKLTQGVKEMALAYVVDRSADRVLLPTIEGLANTLEVSRDSLYEWESDKDFSDILEKLRQCQAEKLIQLGLQGRYNATIAKMMLSKHGYVEKSEVDNNINGAVQFVNDVPRPKGE